MKNEDDLIYDLIFSDQTSFRISIDDYIEDIYKYESFISKIKKILKKSKVQIIESNVIIGLETALWEIKVKK